MDSKGESQSDPFRAFLANPGGWATTDTKTDVASLLALVRDMKAKCDDVLKPQDYYHNGKVYARLQSCRGYPGVTAAFLPELLVLAEYAPLVIADPRFRDHQFILTVVDAIIPLRKEAEGE
jgi:hypothetical protein